MITPEQMKTLRESVEILEGLSTEDYDTLLDDGARPSETAGGLKDVLRIAVLNWVNGEIQEHCSE